MRDKQQTAIEWYANRLCDIEIAYNQGVIDTEVYVKSKTHAYEQAKEMENERMIDFGCLLTFESKNIIEDCYNEIYGYNK